MWRPTPEEFPRFMANFPMVPQRSLFLRIGALVVAYWKIKITRACQQRQIIDLVLIWT
jgi:hypothetical protein